MNISVEQALADLADRVGWRIKTLRMSSPFPNGQVSTWWKLSEHINMIREKIEVKQEIENLVAGKKLEQKILSLTPFLMVYVIKSSSSGFLDPLFSTAAGRMVMTVALLLLLAGYLLSKE